MHAVYYANSKTWHVETVKRTFLQSRGTDEPFYGLMNQKSTSIKTMEREKCGKGEKKEKPFMTQSQKLICQTWCRFCYGVGMCSCQGSWRTEGSCGPTGQPLMGMLMVWSLAPPLLSLGKVLNPKLYLPAWNTSELLLGLEMCYIVHLLSFIDDSTAGGSNRMNAVCAQIQPNALKLIGRHFISFQQDSVSENAAKVSKELFMRDVEYIWQKCV